MRQFAIIGLSDFGFKVARTLSQLGAQVMVIDRNRDRVQECREWASQAVVANAADKDVIKTLGVADVDAVIVSLGTKIDQSILLTMFLKELHAPYVIVKGITEDHKKVLELVGADEVIFPEDEMAVWVAKRLYAPKVINQIDLEEGYSIIEIEAPNEWVGKTLADLQVRSQYRVEVILVKSLPLPEAGASRVHIPDPAQPLVKGVTLVLVGKDEDLDQIKRL